RNRAEPRICEKGICKVTDFSIHNGRQMRDHLLSRIIIQQFHSSLWRQLSRLLLWRTVRGATEGDKNAAPHPPPKENEETTRPYGHTHEPSRPMLAEEIRSGRCARRAKGDSKRALIDVSVKFGAGCLPLYARQGSGNLPPNPGRPAKSIEILEHLFLLGRRQEGDCDNHNPSCAKDGQEPLPKRVMRVAQRKPEDIAQGKPDD